MFTHLVLIFLEALSKNDPNFRMPLRNAIPNLPELIDDPMRGLDGHEVRIGPRTRLGLAIFFGLSAGFFFSCGATAIIWPEFGWFKKPPLAEKILIGCLLAGGPLAMITFFLFWFRGGEILLHRDRVDFQFRWHLVSCPWSLFHTRGDPAWLDTWTLVLPVNPAAIPDVLLFEHGNEVDSGRVIDVKQFRFRRDSSRRVTNTLNLPEIALRDLYRAKLAEIGCLLLLLGSKLGSPNR